MEELEDEKASAADEIAAIIALCWRKLKAELEKHDEDTLAKIERVEKLKSDIERLEEEKKRLCWPSKSASSPGLRCARLPEKAIASTSQGSR